jgi:L-asparagine transporter-like permease
VLHFLWGAVAMSNVVAGLFFLRFWRQTRDRLFAALGAAFLVLALNYLGLAAFQPGPEDRHLVYLVRLAAFAIIIVGIVDKNLRR